MQQVFKDQIAKALRRSIEQAGEERISVAVFRVQLSRDGYDRQGRYFGTGEKLWSVVIGTTAGSYLDETGVRHGDRTVGGNHYQQVRSVCRQLAQDLGIKNPRVQ